MLQVQLSALLSNAAKYVGIQVSIVGRICVTANCESFVAASREGFSRHENIPIDDGGLIGNELLRVLPAYGGGDCLYNEEGVVLGNIIQREGTVRLKLDSYKIVSDGKALNITAP